MNFRENWVVVQYKIDGTPLHCWKLKNIAISSEGHSDGIYWKADNGNLVHVSANYNRVQVSGGNFTAAEIDLGVTDEQCK